MPSMPSAVTDSPRRSQPVARRPARAVGSPEGSGAGETSATGPTSGTVTWTRGGTARVPARRSLGRCDSRVNGVLARPFFAAQVLAGRRALSPRSIVTHGVDVPPRAYGRWCSQGGTHRVGRTEG